ncbi:unnamed protein product [Closterium sp. NIES-54]
MALLRALAFDHEGRPVQFDTLLDDLQLYLLSDSKSSVSLFNLVSGAAPAPPTTADSSTRSQWLTLAHYSSPATVALCHLLLPYLFPKLSAFTTIEDLVSHLRAIHAHYRAAVPAEDHFLSLDPTSLTVDLLEQHLLTAETSAVAVGAARGTPRPPFFEGCSPSPLAPSYASAAAADVSIAADVGAASTSVKRRSKKGKGSRGGGGGSGGGGGGSGSGDGGSSGGGGGGATVGGSGGSGGGGGGSGGSGSSGGGGTGSGGGARHVGSRGGQRQQQQRRSETPFPQQLREWFLHGASGGSCPYLPRLADMLKPRIAIFDINFDAILAAMYALSVSAEGDCYRCVLLDPGIAAAALDASESGTLPATAPAEALHTFMLDSGASRYFFCLHLPSFSANLVSTAALQDAMVTTTTPGGQRVSICTCTRTGRHMATFTRRPGSSLYTLTTEPSQVAASAQPRLRGMHSRLLVSGLPRSLAPMLPSPAPPCLPCVEGRQRAAPHSSSFPSTIAPLQTLHMDVTFLSCVCTLTEVVSSPPPYWDFCRGEDILQSFTLPNSPQKKGIAERRIDFVMEVARTSMIHAAAPHFLLRFAVRYTAHQLNLWPRVSLPKTSPTLRWTGEVGDAAVFRFYHPNSRRVFPSQDVTFDESVPFYRLFPYHSAPPSPLPLFLAPSCPRVAIDSGAAQGAASGGAKPGGAESEGAKIGGAEPWGVETGGAEPGGVATGSGEPGGAEPEGVEPGGTASSGGSAGASPRQSPQQLCEWFVQRTRLRSGAAGAGGTGVVAGAGVTRGSATSGPGGARTRGTGAVGTRGVEGARAGGAGVGGPGAGVAGVGGPGVGGAGAGGAETVDPGGTMRPRPYFVPLLQQILGTPPSAALTPPLLCPLPDQLQPLLQPASPLPAPSPYTEQSGGLTERREPASRPVSRVCSARRVPRSHPPPVPGTHAMALCPSSVPLRVPLPAPPETSLPKVPVPESDLARAASPTISRLLASVVTDPSFESAAASPLVAELLDFASACRLDYATALLAESASASPPSVGGECALGTDVLEDRQEDFECLATVVPRFSFMLLALEGDPDALDIPTLRSYAEVITGPYSSQWQAAMDAEMASWKSTGTCVDEVPPPGANIVDGMWILWVKRPLGSSLAFKAHYVARGFTFLQGSLHEEIWLHRPPGFTESFPPGTQWSLRRPVYGLRQAPREWHDTLRTTLTALGFAPATPDPSLLLRTDTSLPPFYVLVYVDDLVFATADIKALPLVKSELQKRHTCTDMGELRSYLGLQITRDRARRTIALTQSHMGHQVLQRFGFQFSSPQPTPLSTSHSLSAPPSDESVELSGPYPELVGCLMYLMTCTRPDLAYPLSLLARYMAPGRHRKVHWDAAKRVLRYLCSTSGMGLVLGGQGPVVLTGHADASWVDDSPTQRSSQGYTFNLGSSSVSWRSTRSSSVLSSSCEAEIYDGAMAAQELYWLTYLLTDLGEQPRSPPVLYVDNKAMIALCQEHRLEHQMKHIALRYFLARELQQHGQLRLAYVATWANTADVFTKALLPGDHQRFLTVLGLVPTLPHLLTA